MSNFSRLKSITSLSEVAPKGIVRLSRRQCDLLRKMEDWAGVKLTKLTAAELRLLEDIQKTGLHNGIVKGILESKKLAQVAIPRLNTSRQEILKAVRDLAKTGNKAGYETLMKRLAIDHPNVKGFLYEAQYAAAKEASAVGQTLKYDKKTSDIDATVQSVFCQAKCYLDSPLDMTKSLTAWITAARKKAGGDLSKVRLVVHDKDNMTTRMKTYIEDLMDKGLKFEQWPP